MIIDSTIAAATAVLGYDMLRDEPMSKVGWGRSIIALGLTGSAAAGDAAVEVYVGSTKVAKLWNTDTGLVAAKAENRIPCYMPVPKNTQIQVKVVDAPGTNPLQVFIQTSP